MAKPEYGMKRICPNCGSKYYDLNRSPILCPKCGANFDPVAAMKARPAAVADEEDDLEDELPVAVEFVPLDEVEADEADVADIEAVDIDDDGDDDAAPFLEDEEDEGDVSDIIGDVGDEEER